MVVHLGSYTQAKSPIPGTITAIARPVLSNGTFWPDSQAVSFRLVGAFCSLVLVRERCLDCPAAARLTTLKTHIQRAQSCMENPQTGKAFLLATGGY
jgi:hypothetical protein